MKIVVVESPTKAKTINKYLGKGYQVLASFGHVRDLPAKDGSVDPNANFAMIWQVDEKANKYIQEIAQAAARAEELILASDPDREGEAIAWHIVEELEKRAALHIPFKRVVFHEVTKNAITTALKNPRELDRDLIEAYLARRALDYLVGFTLSPVLWRKLPGSRSAGRVQSVALRLITDREAEIEAFKAQEYWSIWGNFAAQKDSKKQLNAKLTHLDGAKLEKFSITTQQQADQAVAKIKAISDFVVLELQKKQTKRNPTPPFTTSTLQQEASRKLGFSNRKTMRIAQQLYEGLSLNGDTTGLITYMRTDSVQISSEALNMTRSFIQTSFGDRYLPQDPRAYKSKAKNAQEAHEAIRPTDVNRTPEQVIPFLEPDLLKLYTLIWKRMVASQMESAVFDQVSVDIGPAQRQIVLRATGSTLIFDGFLKLYQESQDEESPLKEEEGSLLPPLQEKEALSLKEVTPKQHFTQPPPRFTEASLVKSLEELGIGRPSTYASIIQTLQDRNYATLEKKQFLPTDRGRIVTAFLVNFFPKYVQYGFTADLEEQLDDISGGRRQWQKVMQEFWQDFKQAVTATKDLTITQVIDKLDHDLEAMLFPIPEDKPEHTPRKCPQCANGRLGLKIGKFGAFIGCSNYPECGYTRRLGLLSEEGAGALAVVETQQIGVDPKSGDAITLRRGPYGLYLQWGEGAGKVKPKRVSIPRFLNPQDVTLEKALKLGNLPRSLGKHPETHQEIIANIGRFGPYLKHGDRFISLKQDDVLEVALDRAVEIINTAPPPKANRPTRKKATKEAKPTKKETPKKKTTKKKTSKKTETES